MENVKIYEEMAELCVRWFDRDITKNTVRVQNVLGMHASTLPDNQCRMPIRLPLPPNGCVSGGFIAYASSPIGAYCLIEQGKNA